MGINRALDEKNDESKLIEQAKRGHREAFEALMKRYQREIYNLSYRIAGNHHDADDIAQNAFIKAYFSLKKFRGDSSFKTWIYMIALNTAKTFVTKDRKREKREYPLLEEVTANRMDKTRPDEVLSAKGIVARALQSMPERQKEVLILKYFHGMKHVEIAKALRITPGAAKANLFNAMQYLKRKIKDQ
jgi:RNA polymerase sigma-70 factor (ECF subfamily)